MLISGLTSTSLTVLILSIDCLIGTKTFVLCLILALLVMLSPSHWPVQLPYLDWRVRVSNKLLVSLAVSTFLESLSLVVRPSPGVCESVPAAYRQCHRLLALAPGGVFKASSLCRPNLYRVFPAGSARHTVIAKYSSATWARQLAPVMLQQILPGRFWQWKTL